MSTTDELLQREDAAWSAFRDAFSSVPEGRRDVPTVVPGWSVKGSGVALRVLGELRRRRPEHLAQGLPEPEEQDWDALNQAIAKESQAMGWDEVIVGANRGRDRARAALLAMPELTEAAEREFVDETFDHYDEHAAEIVRFAEADRAWAVRPGYRPGPAGPYPWGDPDLRNTPRWPCRARSGTTSAIGARVPRWQVPTTPAPRCTKKSASASGSAIGSVWVEPRSSRARETTSCVIWRGSPVLVRDEDGAVHGFYNVCSHRGTKFLDDEPATGSGAQGVRLSVPRVDLRPARAPDRHAELARRTSGSTGPTTAALLPVESHSGFLFASLATGEPRPLLEFLGCRRRERHDVRAVPDG